MMVSDEERKQFVYFMQQFYWEKHYQKDVTIYSIETDWLKPYQPVFYVGATEDMRKREREHRHVLRKHVRKGMQDDIYRELVTLESLMERALLGSTAIRNSIIAAAHFQGYTVTFTPLDMVSLQAYPQEESLFSEAAKTRFSVECLERERRWIFKKLQEGCTLTNAERVYTEMTGELQARPELDVITAPFSSAVWNPVIQGYLRDIERMGLLPSVP